MEWQWLIDTAGKLGSVTVASAVFITSLFHNRWMKRAAVRTSAVEDQKFRLALLDRRIAALAAVRAATLNFHTEAENWEGLVQHLREALQAAELVFDNEQELQIRLLLREAYMWQHHKRDMDRWDREGDEPKRDLAIDRLFATQERLTDGFEALEVSLKEGTRINAVP